MLPGNTTYRIPTAFRTAPQRQPQKAFPVRPRRHFSKLRYSTLTQSDRRPGGSIRDTLDRCLRSIPTPQAPPGDKPVKGSSRATRSALLPGMGIGPVLRPAVMVASVDRAGFQQKLDRPSVHRPETRATLSRQHLAPRCMMNPSDPTVGSGCNGEYRFSRGDQPSISTSKLHIDRDGAER
jgi:hypothetical protein